jgi:hypothetical protein
MTTENPDVMSTFIAVVEAKIRALQGVLDSLKSAVAVGAFGAGEGIELSAGPSLSNGDLGQPIDLPEGAFNGKSLPACVKLYLSAAKRKKTIKEIASALHEGGVESTSDNFENVVNGAVVRLRKAGEVLRFKDGFGLTEWYPPNMRAVSAAPTKRSKGKKKGKNTKAKEQPASVTAKDRPQKVTEMAKPEDKPQPRILAFFKTHPREVAASEIATALGLKIQTAHLILAKLAHQKRIEKLPSGHFRALGAVAV